MKFNEEFVHMVSIIFTKKKNSGLFFLSFSHLFQNWLFKLWICNYIMIRLLYGIVFLYSIPSRAYLLVRRLFFQVFMIASRIKINRFIRWARKLDNLKFLAYLVSGFCTYYMILYFFTKWNYQNTMKLCAK